MKEPQVYRDKTDLTKALGMEIDTPMRGDEEIVAAVLATLSRDLCACDRTPIKGFDRSRSGSIQGTPEGTRDGRAGGCQPQRTSLFRRANDFKERVNGE